MSDMSNAMKTKIPNIYFTQEDRVKIILPDEKKNGNTREKIIMKQHGNLI